MLAGGHPCKTPQAAQEGLAVGFKLGARVVEVDKGQSKLLAIVGANTSVYVDGTVSKNKSYSYRIQAINAAGKSPYSNTATVKTPK